MTLPAAKRKNIPVDQDKLRRVQKLFNARTATAAVDQALDQVLFGEEVMATLLAAAGKGKGIRDVFGNLR
jgi:Arc/MetJ family transcription regulator